MLLKRKGGDPPAARPITAFFAPLARPALKEEGKKGGEDATGDGAIDRARATAGASPAPPGLPPELAPCEEVGDDSGVSSAGEEGDAMPPPPGLAGAAQASSAPAVDPEGDDDDGPGAAYERARAARIAANAARMAQMGIVGALAPREVPAPAPKRPRRPPRVRAAIPPEAVRRSARTRGGGGGGGGGPADAPVPTRPRSPSPELCFDDDTVLRYVADASCAADAGRCSRGPTLGFSPLPVFLACPHIARLYSIAAHAPSGLLAAGGKDGWAAVWGVRGWLNGGGGGGDGGNPDDPDLLPLVAGRLHRSWLADVALVEAGGCGPSSTLPLLVSASNDGAVAVWNLGACARAPGENGGGRSAPMPQQLASCPDLHGGAGIFSLAASDDASPTLSTAAKDGSVVVCRLAGEGRGLVTVAAWAEAHAGVAKCVRWGPASTPAAPLLASCGNDGAARVWDTRVGPASGAVASCAAFGGAANAVRWVGEHCLAVAGGEPELRIFDLRLVGPAREGGAPPPTALTPPALVLRGHLPGAGRVAGIYQPAVLPPSSPSTPPLVVAGGPQARSLSLYRGDTGVTVSRGAVDHDTVTLAAVGGGNGLLAVAGCRGVHLYRPRG